MTPRRREPRARRRARRARARPRSTRPTRGCRGPTSSRAPPAPACARQRADDRGAQPRHRGLVERPVARLARARRRCRTVSAPSSIGSSPATVAGSARTTPDVRPRARPSPAARTALGRRFARSTRRVHVVAAPSGVTASPAAAHDRRSPSPACTRADSAGRAGCGTATGTSRRRPLDRRPARCRTVTVAVRASLQPQRRVHDADGHDVASPAAPRPGSLTGSVVASVSRLQAALRADDLDGRREHRRPARRRTRAPARLRPTARSARLLRPDRSNSSDTVGGDTCATSTPHGARTSSVSRWNSRGPGSRSPQVEHGDDLAGLEPAERPGRRRARARRRCRAGRRRSRGPPGMFWYSSGTRMLRSTDWSRVTVIHSRTARTSDSSFSHGLRKG